MASFSQLLARRRDASSSLVLLIVSADHAWLVIGAFAAATAVASLAILGLRRPAPSAPLTRATVPIDRRVALAEET